MSKKRLLVIRRLSSKRKNRYELDKPIKIFTLKRESKGLSIIFSTDFFKGEVICMKVVKKGKKQSCSVGKFKCTGKGNNGGGCGAVLLVSQTDLYKTSSQCYGDTLPEYFITFCCPECGVETDVEEVSVEPLGKRPTEKKRKAVARNKIQLVTMQGKKIKVVLGSTNPYKLDAVRKACERLGIRASVSSVKTSSGQNEQPVGFEQTFAGALTRAKSARAQNIDAIAVGVENGVFIFGVEELFFDVAVIVLITPDNRQILTTSAGIIFPKDYVKIAESRRFESTTIGSVIAEKLGGNPVDPHSTLTKGRVSRTMILTDALIVAFAQI